ncbi:hypothetical protein PN36_04180 [Candidatus Thiomargarita nelsonii]|uniref:DUF4384 domain-containing protein n=1 Tax=Candidatus Thiomargarita nelsonii TaxID=1003181 RepID=A0A0A6RVP1_9GAMM|nr:hypothetical protein PN36_04180 [Candidatus Thiomargarita nelsonii]
MKKDELVSFILHNQSEQDYYYYLLDITPDGAISALFPDSQEREEYALIKAGEKLDLSEEALLLMEHRGAETLKLIASTQPFDVLLLEQESLQRERDRGLNPIEQLLVNAVHGNRGLARVSNTEWVTEQVTLEVK